MLAEAEAEVEAPEKALGRQWTEDHSLQKKIQFASLVCHGKSLPSPMVKNLRRLCDGVTFSTIYTTVVQKPTQRRGTLASALSCRCKILILKCEKGNKRHKVNPRSLSQIWQTSFHWFFSFSHPHPFQTSLSQTHLVGTSYRRRPPSTPPSNPSRRHTFSLVLSSFSSTCSLSIPTEVQPSSFPPLAGGNSTPPSLVKSPHPSLSIPLLKTLDLTSAISSGITPPLSPKPLYSHPSPFYTTYPLQLTHLDLRRFSRRPLVHFSPTLPKNSPGPSTKNQDPMLEVSRTECYPIKDHIGSSDGGDDLALASKVANSQGPNVPKEEDQSEKMHITI